MGASVYESKILQVGSKVKPFRAADTKGEYHTLLKILRGKKLSGVYAIINAVTDEVLYVGESHTGNLYNTITRHFRAWKPSKWSRYANGRRAGGTTYDRVQVMVCWEITKDEDAQALQYAEIQRLKPRDNSVACETDRCSHKPTAPSPREEARDAGGDVAPF